METEITDQPIVKIRNLNVVAGTNHILKNIDLDIPKNKLTVFIGPSGCGKTTLLKSMNRLTELHTEIKTTGSVLIEDEDIFGKNVELADLRRKMGLLGQRPFPLPMSIYKNVAYGLKLKGIRDKKLIDYNVEKNLREVGLWTEVEHRLNASPMSLSIGQQQRLCLARGIAVKPRIILADEPTSALDPISSKTIEALFKKMKEHYTIVLVTHVLRQAVRLADYAVFMSAGSIIEQGPADEMFKNPRTPELQDYLLNGN
jgi:phosphate transport system ATP-binding protein